MNAEELEAARAVALRFLGYAARSRSEIERRLAREDIAPEIIAVVVDEMTARGWLDDAEFARQWVADRADRKRYGRGRLAAELRRKGVDKEDTQNALSAVDDEAELRRARLAAQSKWRPDAYAEADRTGKQSEKRRVAEFLQRRGFGWAIITQVLAELTANQE